jgi:hypothetical protein
MGNPFTPIAARDHAGMRVAELPTVNGLAR